MSGEATGLTYPDPPTGLSASTSGSTVTLTWNTESGLTYDVYCGTSSGGESGSPTAGGITTGTYTASGLSAGTENYYYVTAVNSSGQSDPSGEAEGATIPDSPSSVTPTPGDGYVTVGWAAATGADSYNVYRAARSDYSDATDIDPGETSQSYEDDSVANSTTYYYAVTSVNPAGESAQNNWTSVITEPGPPTNLTIACTVATTTTGPNMGSTGAATATIGSGGYGTITYAWGGNGPAPVSISGTSASASVPFTQAGSYTIWCTATDANGDSTSGSCTVTVAQVPTTLTVLPSATSIVVTGHLKRYQFRPLKKIPPAGSTPGSLPGG